MIKSSILILVIFSLQVAGIIAQIPNSSSPARGIASEWTSDSSLFAYRNIYKDFPNDTQNTVQLNYPFWEGFKPSTNEWYESTLWPLYPNLTQQEISVFQPTGFVRMSPNANLIAYSTDDSKLILGNRLSQAKNVTNVNFNSSLNTLYWSENGEILSFISYADSAYEVVPIVNIIRIPNGSDILDIEINQYNISTPIEIGDRVFSPDDVNGKILDITNDKLLITAVDITNVGEKANKSFSDGQMYLILMDLANDENHLVIDAFNGKFIYSGSILSSDIQKILLNLYADGNRSSIQNGLYTYDTESKQISLISLMSDYQLKFSYFSPNSEWLAIETETNFVFFRTEDLLALQPILSPTAFPTFTPFPTVTNLPSTPTFTPSPP